MTLLAVSVFGDTVDEVRGRTEDAVDAGAGLIELRLDLMPEVSDEEVRSLRKSTPASVPILLTIRSCAEGGDDDGADDQRISRLIDLGPWAEFLDIELAAWRRSANLRQKIGLALRRAGHASQAGGVESVDACAPRRLILSRHDTRTRPASLQADLLEMLTEPSCQVPKLAWRARSIRDCFEAFDIMRESPRPVIATCMGEEGLISRVLAKKFGAFATFASIGAGLEAAEGQLPLQRMRQDFRWDAIGPATRLYGVVGDPVHHSLSPQFHNSALAQAGIDAVYLPLLVRPGYESFKAFMVELLARPWLDVHGLSITMPHKVNAFRFLVERGASMDDLARRIGAVNTLKMGPAGELSACNTDASAAIEVLCESMRVRRELLKGLRCLVLGAGGVARAIVAGLTACEAKVSVSNRTAARAQVLADEFGLLVVPWDDRADRACELLINCTNVGQTPAVTESPMPREGLRQGMVVFDTVYQPKQTELARHGEGRGCMVVRGMQLFERQAAQQFEFWTGIRLPQGARR